MNLTNLQKAYFGLQIYQDNYVLESDIKKLPFYDFWKESAKGSTYLALEDDNGIYLSDWISFCKLFIHNGTNRNQIETSSAMDLAFMLENFRKEDLLHSYEEQLNINHELNFKNEELKNENERLKNTLLALNLDLQTMK